MAGIKATGLFLLGSSAGFGVAMLLFVARLLDPMWPVMYLDSTTAFLTGIWLITGGVLGSVVVVRYGKTWRLRTTLVAIAVLAVLLSVTVAVRRRSREFWGLSVQYRLQATASLAKYQRDRLDPRVSRDLVKDWSRHADWLRHMGGVYSRAAYVPWLPVPNSVPCGCRACAAPVDSESHDE